MKSKQKENQKSKIIYGIITMLMIFIGIITAVIAITQFENYHHPYLFGLVFGGLGLICGLIITSRLKPYMGLDKKQLNDFWLPQMYISIGFIGLFLYTGTLINTSLSSVDTCDNYIVIDKFREEGGYRRPEINSLLVQINGYPYSLTCSYKYWEKVSPGQKINLCTHVSKLGFDYISVTDDK